MKKLLTISLLALLASCGGKESESTEPINILENLTYSVDTVVVDSGKDFLSIANDFQLESSSTLAEDQSLFYLFSNKDYTMAVVDLDQLKLLEFLPFEKEGPNGVGEYVQGLQVLREGNFLITNFLASGVFNREGKKLENYKLISDEFDGLDIVSPFSTQLQKTPNQKWLFSLTGFFNEGAKDLIKLNPLQKTGESIDLPAFDMADNFSVTLNSPEGTMSSVPQTTIQDLNGKLYISNEVTSSIYRYDYQTDSLTLITFQHKLVPNAKTGTIRNKVSSREELFSEMEKSTTQVGFKKLLWDEKRQFFFRLGSKIVTSSIEGEDSFESKVYLFAYDADLNLLGETLLENLTSTPRFYFFKDGKLWSYANVNDELGFAVFTFDF
jgi:uncharacterized protein YlzI (FlbEa/FlbD family)